MKKELAKKAYRDAYTSAFTRNGIAFQIQALRKRGGWSQKELGNRAAKKQNVISRLEDPSYGQYTIKTLLELASAFDVALMVRFIPFSELERLGTNLTNDELAVPNYEQEVRAGSAIPECVSTVGGQIEDEADTIPPLALNELTLPKPDHVGWGTVGSIGEAAYG